MSNFDLLDYRPLIEGGVPILPALESITLSRKKRYLLGKFDAIFTISSRETNLIREANPNTFLSTVPIILEEYEEDVDTKEFRRRYGVPEEAPLILCLGRVARIKGQDILLKALPLLCKKVKEFHVLIVGRTDYEPGFLAEMQSYIQEYGLEDRVTFTGGVPRKDVIAALKACDVHVLPVRFMNSGAVVIETWAAGRPVLQSNMIDPNYVVEGENGFSFDIENLQELCDKLVRLLEQPDLREYMGANGRRLVEQKFLYSHLIQQYMDAYREFGGVECG